MADLGFTGVLVPEDCGGQALGRGVAGDIQVELGRHLALLPFLSSSILGASALSLAAPSELRTAVLSGIAAGNTLVALAHEEEPRHAPQSISTVARRIHGGYELKGSKLLVLSGHEADHLIVSARLEDKDVVGLFLVAPHTKALVIEPETLLDGRRSARIELNGVVLDEAALLCPDASGILDVALDTARACLAAELVGIASEAFDRTIAYINQREQFGAKIGSFQALQHRMAHLFCQIQIARAATNRALAALDVGDPAAPLLVSVAKSKATETGWLATNEAVQLHGGIGMTDEADIGLFLKRSRVAGELLGDASFHIERVANLLGY